MKCEICGAQVEHWLGKHLKDAHSLTELEYKSKYPKAETMTEEYSRMVTMTKLRRSPPPSLENLTIKIGGITFPVNAAVPVEACLPAPLHYVLPRRGKLAEDVDLTLLGFQQGFSLMVWGPPGTGKDALFHHLSHSTRTPTLLYQIHPDVDMSDWLFTRSFDANGTHWEEGTLLKALRDGYQCEDGKVIPYTILLTDIDRASRAQAEYLRMILDSIEGRVAGPAGKLYKVLKNTRIVCTANTSGGGDTTGRALSAQPMDASILNRLAGKIEFHPMEWPDEMEILTAKFPELHAKAPQVFNILGKMVPEIRRAIQEGALYGECSHRDLDHLCRWTNSLFFLKPNQSPSKVLRVAMRTWFDGLPDDTTRTEAMRICDGHFHGGVVASGKAARDSSEPLVSF